MIFIDVLYKDLTFKSELIDNIENLPKDDVLFIKLRTDKREGKFANISQIHGFDNYALLHKRDRDDDWFMLYGWDEDEYIWRRECDKCSNREVVDAPIGTMHVVFRGGAVSTDEWEKAIKIINKEM